MPREIGVRRLSSFILIVVLLVFIANCYGLEATPDVPFDASPQPGAETDPPTDANPQAPEAEPEVSTDASTPPEADAEAFADASPPPEDPRLADLPELVEQSRIPFDGCFREASDNPDGHEDLPNLALEKIRRDITEAERVPSKQKLPIVFVPGYLATDTFELGPIEMEYWYNIVEVLNEEGFVEAYAAEIDAFGYSSQGPLPGAQAYNDRIQGVDEGYVSRGEQLKAFVEEILSFTGSSKVNFITHSQGALTARWMISNLGMAPYVNALATVSGPHKGVPLTELSLGDIAPSGRLVDFVEDLMTWMLSDVSTSTDDAHTHYSHVEMWPEYTVNFFNPACPDMEGVQYFSFGAEMVDTGASRLSPYILSPFWIIHELYATDLFPGVGRNDGLITVESSRGPWDDGSWTYVGTLVGRKVIPLTDIESPDGVYWGVDHGNLMNFPLGASSYFHFRVEEFYVDVARMLNAYSP